MRASKVKRDLARFYNINSILGNDWAIFYCIIGGRMTGKSYSASDFMCRQSARYGTNVKQYWMRISDTSTQALLLNKADKLVDPDLKRKYGLDLTTKGFEVYNNTKDGKIPFCTVVPLSAFGKLKGIGFFDKDFKGYYNIFLDEFQLEIGERRTSFDILYNFIGMCENIVRTTKSKVRVFLIGNTLEEASTVLKAFNFLPEKFGRFYLKSKRCVIDNLEPTEEYLKDRSGSIASILGGDDMSNYCNELKKDKELIYKGRLNHPDAIIKFSKEKKDWFTIWDGKIISKYNNEQLPKTSDFAMIPYIDTYYNKERVMAIYQLFDARALRYTSLIAQAYFTDALSMVRKSR